LGLFSFLFLSWVPLLSGNGDLNFK
jgi:hypothetical protein